MVTTLPFVALETRRELELKCVPQLFLGSLLGMGYSAISCYWPIFSLSLETIPEVFAKVNSVQFPSRFWSGEFDNTNPVFRAVSVRPMTSYDDITNKTKPVFQTVTVWPMTSYDDITNKTKPVFQTVTVWPMTSYDDITNNTNPVFWAVSIRPMTSYGDIRLKRATM